MMIIDEEKRGDEIDGAQLMVVADMQNSAGPRVPDGFKFWFTTSIAYVLLLLYVVAVIYMVFESHADSSPNGQSTQVNDGTPSVTSGLETITVMIGGLISALVISISAVTPTADRMLNTRDKAQLFAVILYAAVWVIVGVIALVLGVFMQNTGTFNKTISAIGTTWLSTAVATGYAYFNLGNPSDG